LTFDLGVIFIILVALIFDFLNGFHDAANSIATVVSTRVLSPQKAVLWAAFFNFVAAFVMGTAVAKTMGKGMIDISVVNQHVILAGLIGAIAWNLFTWYYGLPVSSSHALIGGYAGAAVARAGIGAIVFSGWTKTLIFIVLAPLMGAVLGFLLMVAVTCSTSSSGGSSSSRPDSTASATAATTRRRPWASSPACSSPPAITRASRSPSG
jgi:inorganic phosphate transporter, PiT family